MSLDDNYLDALNYAIKEEITDHYFHDRKVVDEEIVELEQTRQETADLAGKNKKLMADLAELLLEKGFWEDFWNRVGMEVPDRTGLPEMGPGVWVGIGRGYGWKGRYKGKVRRLAEKLRTGLKDYQDSHRFLVSLTEEVNKDILKFNQDHDFLMLRSVLCDMDPELVSKKHWLGSTLQGEACFDLEEAMAFKRQRGPEPKQWDHQDLPAQKEFSTAGARIASLVLKEALPKLKARLNGPSPD